MNADRPLTFLMSRQAATDFGAGIADVLQGLPHRFVALEDAPDDPQVDIAFLTREVTGKSGRQVLSAELLRFYELMRASPKLRWMQTHSAGADRPIYAEMRDRGATVTTASGANAEPVAQMAVAGLLSLSRRLPELMAAQREHRWAPLLGERAPIDLKHQTAVVVGLGPVGRHVARLLKALSMTVVGVRRQAAPAAECDETIVFADLAAHWHRADFVVLACPLSDETRGLVNRESLSRWPKGARLINVARGEVTVEQDVIDALRSGALGGAFLDVFEQEPLAGDSPLWDLPNVLISPHTAGHTQGHYQAVGEIFLDNLARWRRGEALINRFD